MMMITIIVLISYLLCGIIHYDDNYFFGRDLRGEIW